MTAPGPQGPVDATEPRNVGIGDRATGNGMPEDQRQNVEEDEMPVQRAEVADTEMSEGNGSSKRGRAIMTSSRQIKRRRRSRYRMRVLP